MATTVRSPAPRSAFAAAFLTFLIPGLGHLYAGAYRRGLVFALLPLSITISLVLQLVRYGPIGFGLWIGQTSILGPLVVLNLLIMAYRIVVAVDAYRIAFYTEPDPLDEKGWGRAKPALNPLSVLGLVGVVALITAGHGLIGYWDLRIYNALAEIHSPVDVGSADATPGPALAETSILPSLLPEFGRDCGCFADSGATAAVTPSPAQQASTGPVATPLAAGARINILLVGVDRQDGGFRTDSMIVANVDPTTHKAALFSMPRDTTSLPMPPHSALSAVWGAHFDYKLNSLWVYSDKYRTLFPGGGADALKQALGYALFGRADAIPYYVLVDFAGFENVIDTLGGVTINVPAPLVDDAYPGNGDGMHERIYIPAGIQHMDGAQALTYARSRKGSNYYDDYNRSSRQEQILVALEQQVDIGAVSSHLGELIDALKDTVHTDIPEGPDVLGSLIEQARFINLQSIRTYAFSPAGYGYTGMFGPEGSQLYGFIADITRIRATVAQAISGRPDPSVSQAVLDEQAPIVVDNGSGTAVPAGDMVARLQSLGLNANPGADVAGVTETQLLVVNGADALYPNTLALLEKTLGLSGPITMDGTGLLQAAYQPGQTPGFVVVTGSSTATPSP